MENWANTKKGEKVAEEKEKINAERTKAYAAAGKKKQLDNIDVRRSFAKHNDNV